MSVKHGILAIISRRPLHGYELRQELESELGAGWDVNFGQIYTTLERLERDGLVLRSETPEGSSTRERRQYAITPLGEEELRKWFGRPIAGGENARSELYAKVMLSFLSPVPTADVIQAQRREELRKMHDLTEMKRLADPLLELPLILQLDQVILQSEATLKWLNMCEARLRRLQERAEGELSVKVKDMTPSTRPRKRIFGDAADLQGPADLTETSPLRQGRADDAQGRRR